MLKDHIVTLLLREIESVTQHLTNGTCPDYASYREHIGMLRAFRDAIEIVKTADATLDEGED